MNNKIAQSVNRFAYDLLGLNELKRNAVSGSSESLKQVAQQFEVLFVNMLMQNMRKTVPESSLFSKSASQLFTSMFDQQIAQQSAGKGFGLADMLTKQLTKNTASSININQQANTGNAQSKLHLAHSLFSSSSSNIPPQALGQMLYHNHKADKMTENYANQALSKSTSSDIKDDYMTQFVNEWLVPAKQAAKYSGIPYEVIIAQAALETGWGQKQIKNSNNQSSYNYFGIKATTAWQGNVTRLVTQEFVSNKMIKTEDNFRVYNSKQHALTDYVNLITNSPRYRAVMQAPDARTAAKALQDAHYATDPNYGDKLIQIIDRIDQIAKNTQPKALLGFKQIAFN